MLFNNKEEFKKLYVDRLTSKYGKSPADAHIYEKYDVLGELVRDYSGTNWRNTRDYVINNEKKQLVYHIFGFREEVRSRRGGGRPRPSLRP